MNMNVVGTTLDRRTFPLLHSTGEPWCETHPHIVLEILNAQDFFSSQRRTIFSLLPLRYRLQLSLTKKDETLEKANISILVTTTTYDQLVLLAIAVAAFALLRREKGCSLQLFGYVTAAIQIPLAAKEGGHSAWQPLNKKYVSFPPSPSSSKRVASSARQRENLQSSEAFTTIYFDEAAFKPMQPYVLLLIARQVLAFPPVKQIVCFQKVLGQFTLP